MLLWGGMNNCQEHGVLFNQNWTQGISLKPEILFHDKYCLCVLGVCSIMPDPFRCPKKKVFPVMNYNEEFQEIILVNVFLPEILLFILLFDSFSG